MRNLALREIGIVLFLAVVGLKSGGSFVDTLTNGSGLEWMGYGIFITLVPLMIVGIIARLYVKLNYLSLCGLLAGSMTDPPALAFANELKEGAVPRTLLCDSLSAHHVLTDHFTAIVSNSFMGLIPFQTWGRITAPIFMLSTTTAIKQFK